MIALLEKNDIFVRDLIQNENVKRCIRITIGTREQMQRVFRIIRGTEKC